jgi:CRP-like cAMP-binding protein
MMTHWITQSMMPSNNVMKNVKTILRPALTLYYLFTMSFRLAFRYSVEYESEFWVYLLLDYLVDAFFWVEFAFEMWSRFQGIHVRPNFMELSGVELIKVDACTRKSILEESKSSKYEVPEGGNTEVGEDSSNSKESKEAPKKKLSVPKVHPSALKAPSPKRPTKPRESQLLRSFSGFDKHAQFNAFEDLLSNFERKCKENEILEHIKSRTQQQSKVIEILYHMMRFFMLFPFEVIAFLAGYQFYHVLRIFRLARLLEIPAYFAAITNILEDTTLMKGASARRVLYFTVFMMVFAHIGACSFYALAMNLLDQNDPVTDVWLSYDGIVEFNDDGSYFMTRSLRYRYIRALYWATVTSQTVGFGDVRPRSVHETSFCFFFFYCSHILAQLAIGNLILLVNVYDTARTKHTAQLAQLEKYAHFRNLPNELKDRIRSFYYHQWKVLNGLDESQFLRELPRNIEIKVRQATVRNCLKAIDLLKNFKISALNALAEDAKIAMYSPNDVIVAAGSQSKGVYVVSRGEAFVHSSRAAGEDSSNDNSAEQSGEQSGDFSDEAAPEDDVVITQSLQQGDVFGAQGLMEKYEYKVSLISGAGVCEIIFLSRARFRRTCRVYFNDAEYHKFVPTNPGRRPTNLNGAQKDKKKYRMTRKSHAHIRSADLNIESGTMSKFGLMLKSDEYIRTCWDVIIFFGIFYYSITVPFELSNSFTSNVFEKHYELFLIGFFVDFLFLLDLLCALFLFPVYKNSVLISTPSQIFQLFQERNHVIIEVICVIPWDILAVVNPNFLPALRLTKLYHLRKFTRYMSKSEKAMNKYLKISFSFAASRFIKLYIALFELCHWVACLWLFTADYSTRQINYDINWKIQDRDSEFLSVDYKGSLNGPTSYKRALYWAINSMATSGVADMPSSNITEMLICCFTLLCGCQTINALLGSIASMMANINTGKRDFANKMAFVSKYMKFKRLPVKLEKRIQFFYEYSFMRTSGANEMHVLAGLPQPLREDVVKFVAGSVLVKIPFFTDCIEPMLEMILGLLTQRLFLAGDDVVIAGEHGKEFFIIEGGTILVTSPDKQVVYASLGNGDYIGESCLLKVAKRTASAHARDYSDTYVLKKEDFEKVVDAFPGDSGLVIDLINEVLDAKAKKNALLARQNSTSNQISNFKKMDSEVVDDDLEKNTATKSKVQLGGMETALTGHTPQFKPSHSDKKKKRWGDSFTWILFIEEGSYARRCWEAFLQVIVLYNLIMVPLRIAIENGDLSPYFYVWDYLFDLILLIDMALKALCVERVIHGKKVMDTENIWENYKKFELTNDLLARLPYDLIALAFIGNATITPLFVLSFLRIPKMFLVLKGLDYMAAAESVLEEARISFFALRMLQVLFYCLLVGHWLGCGLYVFSKHHLGEDCVDDTSADAVFSGNCEFRDTWVQFQIWTEKLPPSGGSSMSRYLRTVNWAIPTMVLYVVGDVYPMNANETSYVFGAMFFGIAINAMIIGTIIALVSAVDDVSADILMKSDTLREHLVSHNVNTELVAKVSEYIKFMLSETGKFLSSEREIYDELPHSLQISVSLHLKLRFFKDCPFFDFLTDEVIRNLCIAMTQQIYYTGDYIISFGDLGQEMFFVESGSCEVVSADKKTVFAKLAKGSFFGETGLVFKSRRTANIRACSLCVCYILNKDQLDRELADCDFDADATIKNLTKLQESNAKRNESLSKNLKLARSAGSKLNKILGTVTEVHKENFWQIFIEPTGYFKLGVDILGYLLVLYYAFVIPFEIAFLFEDLSEYNGIIAFDGVVDFLCILEIMLRLFVFPLGFKKIKTFELKSTFLYFSPRDAVFDLVASLPLELLVFVPSIGYNKFFHLRLIHLLRLTGLFMRNEQIEKHMFRLGLTLQFTTIAVAKGILAYVIVNHWMACMYFAVHRYMEHDVFNSWVVFDNYATFDEETGRHDICNKSVMECYQRSMYFCGTVLTSVGYGDIAPITDIEMVFQVFLAIVGASMGANICGQMSSYLKLSDQSGEMAFKEKLKSVVHYCEYRNLKADLRIAIMANYRTMWRKERRMGAKSTSFMHSLSSEMAGDVALELNTPIMDVTTVFKRCRESLHKRFAFALKPQILLPDTPIYSEMDNGWCIFFILIGKVSVYPARELESPDTVTKACLSILERKHKYLKHNHCTGHHFGEFCLTSNAGVRFENAHAIELTETYSLDKEDLWIIFQRMPFQERYAFLLTIFTEVGGFSFITGVPPAHHLQSLFAGESIKNLYRTVLAVIEDVIESFEERESDLSESSGSEDDEEGRHIPSSTTHYRMRNMSLMSGHSDTSAEGRVIERKSTSKWTQALQAYDKSLKRRNSSRFLTKEVIYKKQMSHASVLVKHAPPQYVHLEHQNSDQEDVFLDSVEKRISALFRYIDTDNSGSIDRNELMVSLLDLGIEKTWDEIDFMMSFADVDGDGEVDIDELVKAVMLELGEDEGQTPPGDEKKAADEQAGGEEDLLNAPIKPCPLTKPSSCLDLNVLLKGSSSKEINVISDGSEEKKEDDDEKVEDENNKTMIEAFVDINDNPSENISTLDEEKLPGDLPTEKEDRGGGDKAKANDEVEQVDPDFGRVHSTDRGDIDGDGDGDVDGNVDVEERKELPFVENTSLNSKRACAQGKISLEPLAPISKI